MLIGIASSLLVLGDNNEKNVLSLIQHKKFTITITKNITTTNSGGVRGNKGSLACMLTGSHNNNIIMVI